MKFSSQTSDNVDRWKSRGGKSQRGEKKGEDQRRERERRKKRQVREKVGKSRFTAFFFQWFVAPEGLKVGSLKQRVRSHPARWEMKSCTPVWREAHFQVKSVKNWRSRTTVGSCDAARSTFPSQNVQSTTCLDHIWRSRCGFAWQAQGIVNLDKIFWLYELQPKFRLMESSIRDIFIFLNLPWAWKTIVHSSPQWTITLAYIPKPEKR